MHPPCRIGPPCRRIQSWVLYRLSSVPFPLIHWRVSCIQIQFGISIIIYVINIYTTWRGPDLNRQPSDSPISQNGRWTLYSFSHPATGFSWGALTEVLILAMWPCVGTTQGVCQHPTQHHIQINHSCLWRVVFRWFLFYFYWSSESDESKTYRQEENLQGLSFSRQLKRYLELQLQLSAVRGATVN